MTEIIQCHVWPIYHTLSVFLKAKDGCVGGGWEGRLILTREQVQPVSEHLFGLWLEILARICPTRLDMALAWPWGGGGGGGGGGGRGVP